MNKAHWFSGNSRSGRRRARLAVLLACCALAAGAGTSAALAAPGNTPSASGSGTAPAPQPQAPTVLAPEPHAASGAAAAPGSVVVRRRSSTSLRLSWTAVPDAVSYRVWRQSTAGVFVKVTSVKASQRSWTDTGLLTGKTQTYQVQACNVVGCGAMSRWVYAVPWKAGDKTVNADRIVVTPPAHPLGQWEQNTDLTAVATPIAKLTKAGAKVPFQTMRYVSSNPSVVTVSNKGILQAGVKLGKATITVIAHDGIQAHVPVSVADYTQPDRMIIGWDEVQDYWDHEGDRIKKLVSIVLTQKIGETSLRLDDNGNLKGGDQLPADVRDLAYTILSDYWAPASIVFNYRFDLSIYVDLGGSAGVQLQYAVSDYGTGPAPYPAPHWWAHYDDGVKT